MRPKSHHWLSETEAQPRSSPCQQHGCLNWNLIRYTCISEWQIKPTANLWICSGNVSLIHVISHFKKGSVIAILSQGSHVHVVTTGAGNARAQLPNRKTFKRECFDVKRETTSPSFSSCTEVHFKLNISVLSVFIQNVCLKLHLKQLFCVNSIFFLFCLTLYHTSFFIIIWAQFFCEIFYSLHRVIEFMTTYVHLFIESRDQLTVTKQFRFTDPGCSYLKHIGEIHHPHELQQPMLWPFGWVTGLMQLEEFWNIPWGGPSKGFFIFIKSLEFRFLFSFLDGFLDCFTLWMMQNWTETVLWIEISLLKSSPYWNSNFWRKWVFDLNHQKVILW